MKKFLSVFLAAAAALSILSLAGCTEKNDDDKRIQSILQEMEEYCCDGTPLELEHEEDNPYDKNAIKVYCDYEHIGYLNRELAQDLVGLVDSGMVAAELSEITGGEDGKSFGCNILIRITEKPAQPAPGELSQRAVKISQNSCAFENGIANIKESRFDGTVLQYIGWGIAGLLLTVCTLGFGFPWACCLFLRWETKHTIINGKRLCFTGTALELFRKWILWWLLTIVTVGIFGLWVWIKTKQWIIAHTVFVEQDGQHISTQPKPKFSLKSNDLVTADGMMEYCRYFDTRNGTNESDCRRLFARAAQSVAPDPQVTMTFMAYISDELCACALANSKLIVATDRNIMTYPVMSINDAIADDGALVVRYNGGDLRLSMDTALAASLAGSLKKSVGECQEELQKKRGNEK